VESNNQFSAEPRIIQLPKIPDKRGNLTFFENSKQIPFAIARVYWIYDVPGGETRGSLDVVLHNGREELKFSLNRSYYGLYIPKMYWRRLENFSTNSLALNVSDRAYNAMDYIRDFEEFKRLRNGK